MSHEPLKTYLRTFRRRTCLSQDEVAYLLGSMCGTSVSRHENGARTPEMRTALGYAFIFRAEVPKLYEGVFREVQITIRRRAHALCISLERRPEDPRRNKKIALLKELLEEAADKASDIMTS